MCTSCLAWETSFENRRGVEYVTPWSDLCYRNHAIGRQLGQKVILRFSLTHCTKNINMKETKISVNLGGNIFKVVSRSILQKATTCKLPEGKRGEEGQSQFTFLFESDNPDCRGKFPPFACISIWETLSILILRILLGENGSLLLGRWKCLLQSISWAFLSGKIIPCCSESFAERRWGGRGSYPISLLCFS